MDEKKLAKKDGFLIEIKGSKHLVVIFGGINQGIGIPVFEFFNILKEKEIDKVFIRDFNQMWYLKGVDEEVNSFENLKTRLGDIIKKYNKVTFLGNSMGGFAAILFGTLLNVDNVIAFSAQTFINRRQRFWSFDKRWEKQIKKIHDAQLHSEYQDLKTVINNHPNSKTKINIYYSSKDRLDRKHSKRLRSFKNVSLNSFSKGGHAVIRELRDSGELHQILTQL